MATCAGLASRSFGASASLRSAQATRVVTTEWLPSLARLAYGRALPVAIPSTASGTARPRCLAAYVDQTPKNDLSRSRAKESGYNYPRFLKPCGPEAKQLAVDAVLVIATRNYPKTVSARRSIRATILQTSCRRFQEDGAPFPSLTTSICHGNGLGPRRVDTSRSRVFLCSPARRAGHWRMPGCRRASWSRGLRMPLRRHGRHRQLRFPCL